MKTDTPSRPRSCRAVVIGGSAGGTDALLTILGQLPEDYAVPLLIVQHVHKTDGGRFAQHLSCEFSLKVREAVDKMTLSEAQVFTAPADYHLLVERDGALALSTDPKVNWSRPSIDVLFESAARAFSVDLVGVILSGSNTDGSLGMTLIRKLGGLCIAQDPATAESPIMPRSAIESAEIDVVLPPLEIGRALATLGVPHTDPAIGAGEDTI